MNLNVWELINLCNLHPRVNILNPGPGVGGHCIALDPWFLISSFPKATNLIQSAKNELFAASIEDSTSNNYERGERYYKQLMNRLHQSLSYAKCCILCV